MPSDGSSKSTTEPTTTEPIREKLRSTNRVTGDDRLSIAFADFDAQASYANCTRHASVQVISQFENRDLTRTDRARRGFLLYTRYVSFAWIQDFESTLVCARTTRQVVILLRRHKLMSLEWFHAMLGAFFVCVWIIVGQIIATDKRE